MNNGKGYLKFGSNKKAQNQAHSSMQMQQKQQAQDHEVYMSLVDKFRNMVEKNSQSNSISKSKLNSYYKII